MLHVPYLPSFEFSPQLLPLPQNIIQTHLHVATNHIGSTLPGNQSIILIIIDGKTEFSLWLEVLKGFYDVNNWFWWWLNHYCVIICSWSSTPLRFVRAAGDPVSLHNQVAMNIIIVAPSWKAIVMTSLAESGRKAMPNIINHKGLSRLAVYTLNSAGQLIFYGLFSAIW